MSQSQPQNTQINQKIDVSSSTTQTHVPQSFPNWSESGVYALYLFLAFLAALALSRPNIFSRRRR